MNNHPRLEPLFKNIPNYDHIAKTPVKDGNYYMPAVAAAMAWTEFSPLEECVGDRHSILCASSYGGTGAGVTPTLAAQLLDKGNQVDIVYLNSWIVNTLKEDIREVIRDNEWANLFYLSHLQANLKKLSRPDNLKYYFFRVPDYWQQPAPPDRPNNTLEEVDNPYPYFAASHIARLLSTASGTKYEGGVFQVDIDPDSIWRNPAFFYSYAYSRLRCHAAKNLHRGFDFVTRLMSATDRRWGLRRLCWDKAAFREMRLLELGLDTQQREIRNRLKDKLFLGTEGQHPLNWTGFKVKNQEMPKPAGRIGLISYPSVFASYFFFKSSLDTDLELQAAYLALIALIATKRVYIEYDTYLAERGFTKETGALPLAIKSASATLGYVGENGLYAWPLFGQLDYLKRLLRDDGTLQEVLRQMKKINGEGVIWGPDSPLGKWLNAWIGINQATGPGRNVWFNMEFFKDIRFPNENTVVPREALITDLHLTGEDMVIQYPDGRHLNISGERHNLFAFGSGEKRILQYTNTLKSGNNKKFDRHDDVKNKLILNYQTVLDLSRTGHEVEILHPAHIFTDRTVEFGRSTTPQSAEPVVPWPLRKEYVACLEPENDWFTDDQVNYPRLNKHYVDMRPHKIKNWGKVNDVDPLNEASFLILVTETLIDGSQTGSKKIPDMTYQCYIWPCDKARRQVLTGWKYYSIMVTARPGNRTLAKPGDGEEELWYYRTLANADWMNLDKVSPTIQMTAWQGAAPAGVIFEFTDKLGSCCGGYFPVLPEVAPQEIETKLLQVGIDFGTLSSCSSFCLPNGSNAPTEMNPSDLLYTVFSNKLLDQHVVDFAWVPYFSRAKGSAKVFPTGLYSLRKDDWDEVSLFYRDSDKIFHSQNPHLPLRHYTIPGDSLDESIANDPAYCVYNIKWEHGVTKKLVYWKDFLTGYLLMLQAHFYMKGQPNISTRFSRLSVYVSVPMKFEGLKIKIPGQAVEEDLKKAFILVVKAAAQDAARLSGLEINFNEGQTVSEAVAPIQGALKGLSLIVDVGGGTTDVAVLSENNCVSCSSFVFAGNNPFRAVYKDDYLRHQRAISAGQQPLEGHGETVADFLYELSAYTALLAGAAIKQVGLKVKSPRSGDQPKEMTGFRIYLSGRAWHLAVSHPLVADKTNAKGRYITGVIKKTICDLFNNRVGPVLLGEGFPPMGEGNIEISSEPENSKLSCSLGTISPGNSVRIDDHIHTQPTFLGISYTDSEDNAVEWFDRSGDNPIPYPSSVNVQAVSPSLLVNAEQLTNLFNNSFNEMNLGDPFQKGRIVRNFAEYLLENRVGGFKGDIRTITLNNELIPNRNKKCSQPG
ncbi:MAG: rod shape-determining protein [Deltaproteobacteria bacterium]|nr:rod shape-determining protein [Deltaproteobacteria bacterium]